MAPMRRLRRWAIHIFIVVNFHFASIHYLVKIISTFQSIIRPYSGNQTKISVFYFLNSLYRSQANLLTRFVCLYARSMRWHIWVLLGPDSNKMLRPGFLKLFLLQIYKLCKLSKVIFNIEKSNQLGKVPVHYFPPSYITVVFTVLKLNC